MTRQISIVKTLNPISGSDALTLHFDPKKGSIQVNWTPNDGCVSGKSEERMSADPNAISVRSSDTTADHLNLFDRTFGGNCCNRPIVVNAYAFFQYKHEPYIAAYGGLYFANYFLSALNAQFVNITGLAFRKIDAVYENRLVIQKHTRKYHKELSLDFEQVDEKYE